MLLTVTGWSTVWDESRSLVLAWQGRDPQAAMATRGRGGAARVRTTAGTALVACEDEARLGASLARALTAAGRLGTRDDVPSGTPSAPWAASEAGSAVGSAAGSLAEVGDDPADPIEAVLLKEKAELLRGWQWRALAHPGVAAASLYYREASLLRRVTTDAGVTTLVRRRDAVLQLTVHAQGREGLGTGAVSLGLGADFAAVRDLGEAVDAAVRDAVDNASAPPLTPGEYDLLLAGPLAATWAHETIGHLAEADHQVGDPRLADAIRPGNRLGPELLTVIDGPGPPWARGHVAVDDEGVAGRDVRLLDAGRVGGRLHSLDTASAFAERPTGNGRCVDAADPPIPRLRTTWIEPGPHTEAELIATTRRGLLAEGVLGGQTDRNGFALLPVTCRLVEDGVLGRRVRVGLLGGDVVDAFGAVDGVGDVLVRADTSAGCGKQGQSHLPISAWAPMLRLRGQHVGG